MGMFNLCKKSLQSCRFNDCATTQVQSRPKQGTPSSDYVLNARVIKLSPGAILSVLARVGATFSGRECSRREESLSVIRYYDVSSPRPRPSPLLPPPEPPRSISS
ncbi:hypothetical protein J6590_000813 [Homalodisca vitripennis]|nr:hypothetical protein J6590_000813 [Homalodisca vitripennis]